MKSFALKKQSHGLLARPTTMRDQTTSLDLTHVLCEYTPMPTWGATNIIITDNDSSLFSLGLALVTLSPILLMVRTAFKNFLLGCQH
jgi:hypothetical protein